MPIIVTIRGYRLLFYSFEGNPREPIHVHVERAECSVKVWVEPAIRAEESYGFHSSEVREIIEVVIENEQLIRRRWDEHFDS